MSETAIVRPDGAQLALNGHSQRPLARIEPRDLDPFQLAEFFARSGFFPDLRDASQALVKILAGAEIGVGPFAAMTGIHVIQGKPVIGANLMATMVKNSRNYEYRVAELTDDVCELIGYQLNGDTWEEIGRSRFDTQDAQRAGLLTGKNQHTWKSYARNMRFSRALSNLVRWHMAGLFGGASVYTPDEFDLEVDGETGELLKPLPPPLPNFKAPLTGRTEAAVRSSERAGSYSQATTPGPDLAALRKRAEALLREFGRDPGPKESKPFFARILGREIESFKDIPVADWTDLVQALEVGAVNKRRAFALYSQLCERDGLDANNREERLYNWKHVLGRVIPSSSDLIPVEWETLANALQANLTIAEEETAIEAASEATRDQPYEDPFQDE